MAKKTGSEETVTYVDKSGKRLDGRKADELRKIKVEVGVIPRALGSAYVEWGQNKVLASVYGPRECLPKHLANPYKAIVRYTYRMAAFSVPDRKNPKPGRREIEISKVSGEALARAIFLERFPNTAIDVDVEILDSNAGTRVAALTAASVALADAGIPMRDLVAGIGVGKAGGHLLVDLNKAEEDAPDAVDIPMAILPNLGEVVLLQLDGLMTQKEWEESQKLAFQHVKKVYELQKEALKKKYAVEGNSGDMEAGARAAEEGVVE
ncbi:MAG TPA: exosome complex exonuclease Rrp41 [Candidatus Diapherotrites archaeon]|uniref:Exosome complex exonuclease Rrp41 n=1 Tax=Candidatus Iainarchaeum sp. TaxID=3101447 RepID=A0A7J4JE96_9ARCH|nr:exosome complex exonuclease Rrp41 [Candidatus Diapherotrites archaeon]